MGLENPIHLLIVLAVVLMVFGAKRLPEMGRSLGDGMRGFKEAISGQAPPVQTMTAHSEAPVAPASPATVIAPATMIAPATVIAPSAVIAPAAVISPATMIEPAVSVPDVPVDALHD